MRLLSRKGLYEMSVRLKALGMEADVCLLERAASAAEWEPREQTHIFMVCLRHHDPMRDRVNTRCRHGTWQRRCACCSCRRC